MAASEKTLTTNDVSGLDVMGNKTSNFSSQSSDTLIAIAQSHRQQYLQQQAH